MRIENENNLPQEWKPAYRKKKGRLLQIAALLAGEHGTLFLDKQSDHAMTKLENVSVGSVMPALRMKKGKLLQLISFLAGKH